MMVLGGNIDHEDGALMNGPSALIKETQELCHSFCHVRQPSMNLEAGSHQTQNRLEP